MTPSAHRWLIAALLVVATALLAGPVLTVLLAAAVMVTWLGAYSSAGFGS